MAERDRARELLTRDALWRAWTEVARGGDRLDETGGAEAVARMVLADPYGWQLALGWAHVLTMMPQPDDYRCTRCGIVVKLSEPPTLCSGVPS